MKKFEQMAGTRKFIIEMLLTVENNYGISVEEFNTYDNEKLKKEFLLVGFIYNESSFFGVFNEVNDFPKNCIDIEIVANITNWSASLDDYYEKSPCPLMYSESIFENIKQLIFKKLSINKKIDMESKIISQESDILIKLNFNDVKLNFIKENKIEIEDYLFNIFTENCLVLPICNSKAEIMKLNFTTIHKKIKISFYKHYEDKRNTYVWINHSAQEAYNDDEKDFVTKYFEIEKNYNWINLKIPIINEDECLIEILFKIIYSLLINNIISIADSDSESNLEKICKELLNNVQKTHSPFNTSEIIKSLRNEKFKNFKCENILFKSLEYISYPFFNFILLSHMELYFTSGQYNFASKKYVPFFKKCVINLNQYYSNICYYAAFNYFETINDIRYKSSYVLKDELEKYNDRIKKIIIGFDKHNEELKTTYCQFNKPINELFCEILILDCFIKGIMNKSLSYIMYNSTKNEIFYTRKGRYEYNVCTHAKDNLFKKQHNSTIIIGNSGVGKTYGFNKIIGEKIDCSHMNEEDLLEKIFEKSLNYVGSLLGCLSDNEELLLIDEFNRGELYHVLKKYILIFDLDKNNITRNFLKIKIKNNIINKNEDKIKKIINYSRIGLASLDTEKYEYLLIKFNDYIEALSLIINNNDSNDKVIDLFLTPKISFHLIMNTSDKNTFELDSFWARRFSFKYVSLEKSMSNDVPIYFIKDEEKHYDWDNVRNFINNKMKKIGIPQDKLIGYFFWNHNELEYINNEGYEIKFNIFINKISYYIYYQALKNGDKFTLRFNEIDENTLKIFNEKYFDDIIKSKTINELFKGFCNKKDDAKYNNYFELGLNDD